MNEEQAASTRFPPYFDRFINERDHRLIAELGRLETNIAHNLRHIDQLRREIERSIAEAKDYREMAREERRLGAASAKQEREAISVTIQCEFGRLHANMDSRFRKLMAVMILAVVGILAIIVRVFLVGIMP